MSAVVSRDASAFLLAVSAVVLAGCVKAPTVTTAPPEEAVPQPPAASQPLAKRPIPDIDTLPQATLKRYLDECLAHNNDIAHPSVPYLPQDCARVRSRWARRDLAASAPGRKHAPFLPPIR